MANSVKKREFFFKFFLAEIAEKIVRLELFVDDTRRQAPKENHSIFSIYDESIRILKSDFQKETGEFMEAVRKLDKGNSHYWMSHLHKKFFGRIETVHKCFRWIYTPWAEKETYAFLRQLLFESEKKKTHIQELKFTVVFTNDYTFLKHDTHKDLPDYTDISEAPVLALPKIEKGNPLVWTILVHELGHILAEEYGVIDRILEDVKEEVPGETKVRMLRKWIAEICADVASLQLLGPASILPFVTFCITLVNDNLHQASKDHPPPYRRAKYLWDSLETDIKIPYQKLPELEKYYSLFGTRCDIDTEIGYRTVEPKDFEQSFFPSEFVDSVARSVYDSWWSETSENQNAFGITNYETAKRELQTKSLSNNIPIASYLPESASRFVRSHAEECEKNNRETGLDDIYSKLDEEPSRMNEIINAGWIDKSEHQAEWLEQCFLTRTGSVEESFGKYKDKLVNLDLLLQKSMETSLIHKFYYQKL